MMNCSRRDCLKKLPKLISSIDEIAGDMDGFGYQGEAASMWRQMILVLKRQFDDAPSDYRVHLGVSWEQYGAFLIVCSRQREAEIASGEAAAHGNALCGAGIPTFIAPTLPYFRYRQRSLFNFGAYRAACEDAEKLVDYSRCLYRSGGAKHAELLALGLLWHRDSLMEIGRTSEADACLDEAVRVMQSGQLRYGEASLPGPQPLISLTCAPTRNDQHLPSLPQPLRFKHPLTSLFDIFWEMDWGNSYDRAITVEERAVMCARELFHISRSQNGDLLARTLRHYGNALHRARKYETACHAHAEAVEITRELCQLHPGKYEAELVDRLREYSVSLHSGEMYERACNAYAEAIDITRELCRLHQGEYMAELAHHLEEYGVSLHSREMYEAVCNAHTEAVDITRELCRLHPGEYMAELADRLQTYGVSLHSREMYEAACNADAEAIDITRELCRLHPGEYMAELADRLRGYGVSLHSREMYEAACNAKAEAVDITRELCRLHPGEYMAELAARLQAFGISLHSREMYEAACNADSEAVDITRKLCQLHPGKYTAELADRLRSSSVSLRMLHQHRERQGSALKTMTD